MRGERISTIIITATTGTMIEMTKGTTIEITTATLMTTTRETCTLSVTTAWAI